MRPSFKETVIGSCLQSDRLFKRPAKRMIVLQGVSIQMFLIRISSEVYFYKLSVRVTPCKLGAAPVFPFHGHVTNVTVF